MAYQRKLKEEKEQEVEILFDKLTAGVQNIFSSGKLEEMAKFFKQFHKYSFHNMLLIMIQCENASLVAGYKTWQGMGRFVKKGEKGIKILAPKTFKKTERDEETGEEVSKTGLAGFKTVSVFDVSQTDGKDLPGIEEKSLGQTLVGDELFERLMATCPVPVRFDSTNGSKGYYSIGNKEIVLSSNLVGDDRAAVLLHETAHALAFATGEQKAHKKRGDQEYVKGEIIAEGAAYMAGTYFGLTPDSISFEYVAGWAKKPELLFCWGESVMRIARRLIELVEQNSGKAVGAVA